MRERLLEVMADLFGCAPEDIPEGADTETLEGWDSLRQVELMIALEGEFDLRFPTAAMLELNSLEKIDRYLREHASGSGQAA